MTDLVAIENSSAETKQSIKNVVHAGLTFPDFDIWTGRHGFVGPLLVGSAYQDPAINAFTVDYTHGLHATVDAGGYDSQSAGPAITAYSYNRGAIDTIEFSNVDIGIVISAVTENNLSENKPIVGLQNGVNYSPQGAFTLRELRMFEAETSGETPVGGVINYVNSYHAHWKGGNGTTVDFWSGLTTWGPSNTSQGSIDDYYAVWATWDNRAIASIGSITGDFIGLRADHSSLIHNNMTVGGDEYAVWANGSKDIIGGVGELSVAFGENKEHKIYGTDVSGVPTTEALAIETDRLSFIEGGGAVTFLNAGGGTDPAVIGNLPPELNGVGHNVQWARCRIGSSDYFIPLFI